MRNIQMCIPVRSYTYVDLWNETYTHEMDFFFPHINLCKTSQQKLEHMSYWDRVTNVAILHSLLFCAFKEKLFQSFVWLNTVAQTDAMFSFGRVFVHRQICAFLCALVCVGDPESGAVFEKACVCRYF